MNVKLIHKTENAETLLAYIARVSSPNQENEEKAKLIKYLIINKHWSPLEMVNMCLEIETTRAISPQILRHRSFSFQEFSQRYAEVKADNYSIYPARRQDVKNRQNSIDDLPQETQTWFEKAQQQVGQLSEQLYKEALDKGIAKECSRFLLPLSTNTKLYMNGTLRSWVHYIELRCDKSTQKEHRDIAEACKLIFIQEFPLIAEALGWK